MKDLVPKPVARITAGFLVAILIIICSPQPTKVSAKAITSYSNSNISGTFSFSENSLGFNSKIGTLIFDGSGGITDGSASDNSTDVTQFPFTSTITNFTFVGSYSVNTDGTGTFSLTITEEDGSTIVAIYDFVVFGVEKIKGEGWQATELRAYSRERNQLTATFGTVQLRRLNLKN